MTTKKRLLIVGGGIAGLTAASSARDQWPDAQIAVVEADPHPAYNKIALGAFVVGKSPRDRLRLLPNGSLQRRRIEFISDASAREIEPSKQEIVLNDGRSLGYDSLILATGAAPVLPHIPGLDLPGVSTLWSMNDALRAQELLRNAGRVSVVGGGVLGVELAAALRESGRDVALFEAQNELLPGMLDETAMELYTDAVRKAGVRLSLGDPAAEINRTLLGLEVRTAADEAFACDMVFVTAGVTPRVELARRAGLPCRRGVLVDRFLRTGDPHILACGNCIELDGRLQPLWNPAVAQGRVAGINAFENSASYEATTPILHVKTPQMPLFVCGDRPESPDASEGSVLTQRTTGSYRAVAFDDQNTMTYAVFFGDTTRAHVVEKAVTRGARVPEEAIQGGDLDHVLDELEDKGDTERSENAWSCRVCGFVHEGDAPPQVCPICAVGPDQFMAA